MTINDAWQNIELAKQAFRPIILTGNAKKLSSELISWDNYRPGIFKSIYAKEYEAIIKGKQYSFLLAEDQGCIQFYYEYQGTVLKKAKLAYYPYPIELREEAQDVESLYDDTDDPVIQQYYFDLWNILSHQFELTVTDETLLQNALKNAIEVGNTETMGALILARFNDKYKLTNSSHIRIDYDAAVESHHKCEIQIGAVNKIRFPMKHLVSPFVFTDFIAKNLFKDQHVEIIKKAAYKTDFAISKKVAFPMNPFSEENIFTSHD
jgi:hypothetical protein